MWPSGTAHLATSDVSGILLGAEGTAPPQTESHVVLPTLQAVLAEEAARRTHVWRRLRGDVGSLAATEAELARLVVEDPSSFAWREVDAALERSRCDACGRESGAGERGCTPCDQADGTRFAGQERDRPGVPPGNEHAVRVALTLVRFPHRWPEAAVAGARLYLPRFVAGDLPTRSERYALLRALREGRGAELADAPTFADMARRTGYL